jgi:hypothetical protein
MIPERTGQVTIDIGRRQLFVINLQAARTLGIAVPSGVLSIAEGH